MNQDMMLTTLRSNAAAPLAASIEIPPPLPNTVPMPTPDQPPTSPEPAPPEIEEPPLQPAEPIREPHTPSPMAGPSVLIH